MEKFTKAEVYLVRFAVFLLLVVGLVKFLWFEISPFIRDIVSFQKDADGSYRRVIDQI